MKHTFTIITITALTLLAVLSGCKKDYPSNKHSVGTVKDICGNTYNYVKIGEQYWTAENMRCNKYDTQSERKGETLSTSSSYIFAPYYIDASNKAYWEDDESMNLSSEQVSHLGYLYNWAAAVGLESESAAKSQATPFNSNRQGICPNGWHIPSTEEWSALENYVGTNAGKELKSSSGWSTSSPTGKPLDSNGTDQYGFSALPSGVCVQIYTGCKFATYYVGCYSMFITADASNMNHTVDYFMYHGSTEIHHDSTNKSYAHGVRCIKN